MNKPLITVGIPFYNSEDTLLDAVKSIFAQTFQDWELILVDDGSTDRSLEIARSIDDDRVRVLSDGANKKLPARLNQINQEARGKWIARMDADDLCSPTRLEKQVRRLRDDPNLDVLGTGMIFVDDQASPVGEILFPAQHEQICRTPYRTFYLVHSSIMARKEWYQNHRYDESVTFGQDFHLWLNSYETSTFANLEDPLYFYRCEYSYTLKKQYICRRISSKFLFHHYWRKRQPIRASIYAALPWAKLAVVAALCLANAKRKILEKRYNPVREETKLHATEEVEQIRNTEIPLKS
jgi:glycosyltransferase involved in cell wall biosynthesis